MKRKKEIRVLCSDDELKKIGKVAEQRGLSLPSFLRMVALEAANRQEVN